MQEFVGERQLRAEEMTERKREREERAVGADGEGKDEGVGEERRRESYQSGLGEGDYKYCMVHTRRFGSHSPSHPPPPPDLPLLTSQ